MLGNYKIRVNNEAESKEAQELFEQLGFEKTGFSCDEFPYYLATWEGGFSDYPLDSLNVSRARKQITLTQLRDMVGLDSNGANKSTPAYKQVIKYQSEDGMLFDTEQECINYHNERKLVNLLEDNIYALRHEDGGEVLDLMRQHKELFLEYLQKI